MAITDTSDDIVAVTTDLARQYLARVTRGEFAWQAVGFSVGRGGYNPADPVKVLPILGSEIALTDQVYPAPTGYAAFEMIETPNPMAPVFDCRLASTLVAGPADYGLGEIAIWAKIVYVDPSTVPPPLLNDIFMLALGHMPIRAKTRRDVMLLRVAVQF